jgi:hypothetical protein
MKVIILIILVLLLVYFNNKSKFGLISPKGSPSPAPRTSPRTSPKGSPSPAPRTKSKLEIAKENAQISINKQQALLDSANVFKTKALDNQTSVNNSNIPNKTELLEKANKTVINANNAVTNAIESLDTAKKQLEALNKT